MLYRAGYRMFVSRLLVLVTAIAPLWALPAESEACCFRWLCGRRTTPTFQPAVAAPACTTCQPQTVQYVPQTCYRTVVQNVPVTTCRAVSTCDPCTGCPITTMQPVTSYVRQVRYVPYTTYRAVAVPATCATTASYAAPSYAAPGCATGNCGGTSPGYAAPATGTPTYAPAPAATPTPSFAPSPTTPATGGANNSSNPPQTFQKPALPNNGGTNNGGTNNGGTNNGGTNNGQADQAGAAFHPAPAASSSGYPAFSPSNTKSTNDRRPKLFDPRDRAARYDRYREDGVDVRRVSVARVRPAVHVVPTASDHSTKWSQEQIDAAGWRAAGR